MNSNIALVRQVGNRLLVALLVLLGVTIPGALIANSNSNSAIASAPMMALLIGSIGGFVGLQRRLKTLPPDDLTLLAESWVHVCLSPVVGGILAVMLYVLFVSNLVAGDMFPKFTADTTLAPVEGLGALFRIHGTAPDYAKLIFWCFLAGFSERFATNILGQFEDRSGFTDAKNKVM